MSGWGSPKQRLAATREWPAPAAASGEPSASASSLLGRTSADALRTLWALFGPAFWCVCLFVTLFYTMESRRSEGMRAWNTTEA